MVKFVSDKFVRRSANSPNIPVWRANLTLLSAHSDAETKQTT
nr:hypothetical protein [Gilliamella apicola]